jgi:hypothetical protein
MVILQMKRNLMAYVVLLISLVEEDNSEFYYGYVPIVYIDR